MRNFPNLIRSLYRGVMRHAGRLGAHLFLVELGDSSPDIAMPQLAPGYTATPVPLEQLRPWVDQDNGLSDAFLDGAAARGDRCVANFYNGALVGYGFVTRTRAPVTEQIDVVIDDRLAYRYKGWTHPEHRRKHLSHARGRINRRLFNLTAGQRMVSYVDSFNPTARQTHSDVHPIRLGIAGFVTLFGREYPFTGRIPRRYGFRLQRRDA